MPGRCRDLCSHLTTFAPQVASTTLVQFSDPVSPHLAATQATGALPDEAQDAQIIHGVRQWLMQQHGTAIVETAGGVHSPAPSGLSQADLLRPLRLPTVLVGSSKLGGIGTTRAALESLRMRGYDIDAVLLFPSERYGNDVYLGRLLEEEHGIPVFALGGPSDGGWGAPPIRAPTTAEDVAAMRTYYAGLVAGRDGGGLGSVVRHLQKQHADRLAELRTLGTRTYEQCWWPFTQHARYTPQDVMAIDSAHGDTFATYNATSQSLDATLDGSASWWTQCFGHAHPRLTQAAAYAAGRYGHVLFPGAANQPALDLAERLLGTQPLAFPAPGSWASRVFFSDDGSTAMEVALKMAIQSSARRYAPQAGSKATQQRIRPGRAAGSLGGRPEREWEVLGLQGSYHGDTIGAMDACEPSTYSDHVAWYRGRGYWLAPPALATRNGQVDIVAPPSEDWDFGKKPLGSFASMEEAYDVEKRLGTPLADEYRDAINATLERLVIVDRRRFGALVLEPLVMGAGGMVFVDPLFQRILIDVVRAREDLFAMQDAPLRDAVSPAADGRSPSEWRGLPVVFDEVFTGLFRLGYASATEVLGTTPDIACYAKILSGGLVPLSVTLASSSIFDTFRQTPEKVHALLHGHSYTAHPVGCAVANETLSLLDEMVRRKDWAPFQAQWGAAWSFWDRAFVERLSRLDGVASAMALGTVLKIELADAAGGYASTAAEGLLAALRSEHIHLRPLGNVVYVMCSLNTPQAILSQTQAALEAQLRS